MRKELVVAVCLMLGASVAGAQSKFDSKWHCDKPAVNHSLDVGDVAGHSFVIEQGNCTSTASAIGEKSGVFTEFVEGWKKSGTIKGRFNVTLENGEKVFHSYQSTFDPVQNTIAEKWTVADGTGKYKGAKGSGTCKGKVNGDGTSDWDCTGTIVASK
jgi:hypothetical protein